MTQTAETAQTAQALFLFLYGLFWAEMLATSARYNGFPTAKLCGSEHVRNRPLWARRLVASLLLLNFFPILWLVGLYTYVVPSTSRAPEIAAAALSSLSIFGILRVYHGIVASKQTVRCFFTKEEEKELEIHGPGGSALTAWAHIVPGAIYLLVLPGLADAVGRVWR